jgi:hypothetical protein
VCALAFCAAGAQVAEGKEWFVSPEGIGDGTSMFPFGRIQDAIAVAQAGDTVSVAAGTYNEQLRTVRSGTSSATIRVRAVAGRGSVLVTAMGRVLTVSHAYVSVSGLVLDGRYGQDDVVRVSGGGNFFQLLDSEVRRSSKDLIDMGSPRGVRIENCLLHHALNAKGGRTDAHGIVTGPVRDLTILDTEIHTFSGDGFQVDPSRSAPGWSDVTIERARIWLAPLPAPENGFPAGAVPGENAVDTKANPKLPRARIVIRDTQAWGFRGGFITNMAAFNLKENIDATVDRVTVHTSEIAFRLRGPGTGGAWVAVQNAVIYDVLKAFRYEDNIKNLRIWNSTTGAAVTRVFQAASSTSSGLDVRNLLVLGPLPSQASHPSNMSVGPEAFSSVATHTYALVPGAAPVDAGVAISKVTRDRVGVKRPQGAAYDIGAYELPVP